MPSFSGLWNGAYGVDYTRLAGRKGTIPTRISRALARQNYSAGTFRQLMRALNGVAPGANATEQWLRLKSERNLENNVQGGLRTIETVTYLNRVTTAADQAQIESELTQQSRPTTYPQDAGGNGGGNKRNW